MEHPRPWLPASVMLSFCSGVSWSLSWLLTLFTVFIVPDTTESGFSWPSWGWPGTGATGDHVTGSDLLTFTGITPPLITFSTNFVLLRMRATASLCVAKERGTPHILTIWSPGWRPWLQSYERILGLANIQGVHKRRTLGKCLFHIWNLPFWGFYGLHPNHNLWQFDYLHQGFKDSFISLEK